MQILTAEFERTKRRKTMMDIKLTFYDFLSIFIPGLLLTALFVPIYDVEIGCFSGILLFAISYIFGLIYHKIIEYICKPISNHKCLILKAREKFVDDLKNRIGEDIEKVNLDTDYYAAYYKLMKHSVLGSMPTLEAQFAFLRNMILVIVAYAIALSDCGMFSDLFRKDIITCRLQILLILFIPICLFIAYLIQKKIHYLVWEGAYYIDSLTKKQ